jgi:hypothetical protein
MEQILDARADPSAKMRVLNGVVNVAKCPHCGARGSLSVPFLYHDPDKELALVYVPMGGGLDNLERQRIIGQYTSAVMDGLPPEDRKAYLLQPQVFLTPETLVNKILEADGVTPEMIEEQKAKAALLQRMIATTSNDVLEAMIRENDSSIDADLFRLLAINLEVAQSRGDTAAGQRLVGLRTQLMELSTEGRRVQTYTGAVESLRENPTRERLLELLIQAPDEEARQILVTMGRPLVDYRFFLNLTSQIEASSDEDEQKQLTELRKEILAIRDRLDEEAKALYAARGELLRDLLLSDDPENLAKRRFNELDEAFTNVFRANLGEAKKAGEEELVNRLQSLWQMILRVLEEATPPELRLFGRLVRAEDDAEIDQILESSRDLVSERLVKAAEEAEASMREAGEEETADRMALVREKARAMIGKKTPGIVTLG